MVSHLKSCRFVRGASRLPAMECLVYLGGVMGSSCQAGERNAEGKAEMGRRKPEDRGQESEAGGRRGIYVDSLPEGWFFVFVFAPVTLCQAYCWGYA